VVGADIIGGGGLAVWGLMMMVLLLFEVAIVTCEERHPISRRTLFFLKILVAILQKQVLHCEYIATNMR
jgi:hypothetical protein